MRFFLYILFFLNISIQIFGQNQKTIQAVRINSSPVIDGKLDDSVWQKVPSEANFIQYEPYNNKPASQVTKVYFAYDNKAVYIAARCENDKNGKIYDLLTKRDDFGQADYFGVYLDTYNTAITGFGFFVTAAGVQIDMKIDNNVKDFNWDAVWYSKVTKDSSGYTVEMKIPFSAFRFPAKENEQTWGVNFYRNLQYNREIDTWNFVDINKNGILNQMGKVTDLQNLKPPLHLDIMPHFTSYLQRNSDYKKLPLSYTFGMDIKYSINQSFTLDMMLIPDFGQIRSDEEVLNLSPYEIYYDEKRYFFTEGTEIFNKGNIFYSRRIGRKPSGYNSVNEKLNKNEIVINNPEQTLILNATKFSGKTNNGIGIGILNAVTANAYAKILDTVKNNTRTILTEPWANYNVMAVNFPLLNNSYFSFTSTNYFSPGTDYQAEVWAQTIVLRNKTNSWALNELLSQSYILDDTLPTSTGTAIKLAINKTSGRFRFSFKTTLYDNKYNPNDLGYLATNNIVNFSMGTAYNIYQPFWKLLNLRNSFNISHKRLYVDFMNVSTTLTATTMQKWKNFTSTGLQFQYQPLPAYDYFEPRVDGRFFVRDIYYKLKTWISTNYSNPIAFDFSTYFKHTKQRLVKPLEYGISYGWRFRLSNQVLFTFGNSYSHLYNDAGYVAKEDEKDSIFFGIRDIRNQILTSELDYNIRPNLYFNLRLRHYWSIVDYKDYYLLALSGYLYPLDKPYHYFENKDINSNFFNVDFILKWIFTPGTELTVSYKMQISSSSQNLVYVYYDDFEQMYFNSPRLQSFSVKFILYLNSNTFHELRKIF